MGLYPEGEEAQAEVGGLMSKTVVLFSLIW